MQTILTVSGPVLELAILTGLLVRRRVSRAATLPFLLLALIVSATVVAVCPDCNTWDFWITKELTHIALFLLLALEVGARAIEAREARRAACRWGAFVLAVTLTLVVTAHGAGVVVEILPRLMGAIAWLYTGLIVVMLRYDVRVEPLHDAILSGFTPYLVVYAATWSHAADDTRIANLVNPVMFVFVLLLLLRAAWQKDAPRAPLWMRRSYRTGPPEPPSSSSPRSWRGGSSADTPGLA